MVWYYAEGNNQIGPKSEAEFQQLVSAGVIRADTLVWREGMPGWKAYGEVDPSLVFSGTQSALQAQPYVRDEGAYDTAMTICSSCGNTFPSEDVIEFAGRYVCAACKPAFVQQLKESGRVPGAMAYAGFWIRLGARIIDTVILVVANYLVTAVLEMVFGRAGEAAALTVLLLSVLINWGASIGYFTYFHGRYGATPGKLALGLRVVREDGSPITYLRAFARYWGDVLTGLTFFIGYIIAAFDDEKRALHDHICSTRVVHV
ncbi:MAG: RDD family protein [Candidatus Hydrogenedentes bacterium]|nr:RDD family protein [Candidatus Hydrogenedentota bacterium]